MKEYIELGSTPYNEKCSQVGEPNYTHNALSGCRKYIQLLKQCFPDGTINNAFRIKSFNHDFGTYYEVVCYYDSNDAKSIDFAYFVEDHLPKNWSDTNQRNFY